jgi:hypothetical protein
VIYENTGRKLEETKQKNFFGLLIDLLSKNCNGTLPDMTSLNIPITTFSPFPAP